MSKLINSDLVQLSGFQTDLSEPYIGSPIITENGDLTHVGGEIIQTNEDSQHTFQLQIRSRNAFDKQPTSIDHTPNFMPMSLNSVAQSVTPLAMSPRSPTSPFIRNIHQDALKTLAEDKSAFKPRQKRLIGSDKIKYHYLLPKQIPNLPFKSPTVAYVPQPPASTGFPRRSCSGAVRLYSLNNKEAQRLTDKQRGSSPNRVLLSFKLPKTEGTNAIPAYQTQQSDRQKYNETVAITRSVESESRQPSMAGAAVQIDLESIQEKSDGDTLKASGERIKITQQPFSQPPRSSRICVASKRHSNDAFGGSDISPVMSPGIILTNPDDQPTESSVLPAPKPREEAIIILPKTAEVRHSGDSQIDEQTLQNFQTNTFQEVPNTTGGSQEYEYNQPKSLIHFIQDKTRKNKRVKKVSNQKQQSFKQSGQFDRWSPSDKDGSIRSSIFQPGETPFSPDTNVSNPRRQVEQKIDHSQAVDAQPNLSVQKARIQPTFGVPKRDKEVLEKVNTDSTLKMNTSRGKIYKKHSLPLKFVNLNINSNYRKRTLSQPQQEDCQLGKSFVFGNFKKSFYRNEDRIVQLYKTKDTPVQNDVVDLSSRAYKPNMLTQTVKSRHLWKTLMPGTPFNKRTSLDVVSKEKSVETAEVVQTKNTAHQSVLSTQSVKVQKIKVKKHFSKIEVNSIPNTLQSQQLNTKQSQNQDISNVNAIAVVEQCFKIPTYETLDINSPQISPKKSAKKTIKKNKNETSQDAQTIHSIEAWSQGQSKHDMLYEPRLKPKPLPKQKSRSGSKSPKKKSLLRLSSPKISKPASPVKEELQASTAQPPTFDKSPQAQLKNFINKPKHLQTGYSSIFPDKHPEILHDMEQSKNYKAKVYYKQIAEKYKTISLTEPPLSAATTHRQCNKKPDRERLEYLQALTDIVAAKKIDVQPRDSPARKTRVKPIERKVTFQKQDTELGVTELPAQNFIQFVASSSIFQSKPDEPSDQSQSTLQPGTLKESTTGNISPFTQKVSQFNKLLNMGGSIMSDLVDTRNQVDSPQKTSDLAFQQTVINHAKKLTTRRMSNSALSPSHVSQRTSYID